MPHGATIVLRKKLSRRRIFQILDQGHAGLPGNSSTSTKSCWFSDCQAERNGEGSEGRWETVAIDVLPIS